MNIKVLNQSDKCKGHINQSERGSGAVNTCLVCIHADDFIAFFFVNSE